jgi:hypothetical protein
MTLTVKQQWSINWYVLTQCLYPLFCWAILLDLAADFWQMVGWWPHYEYNRKKTESIKLCKSISTIFKTKKKQLSFKLMGEQISSKQTECLPQHIISFSLRCRQLPSAGVITETRAEATVQLNTTAVASLHNTWNKFRHIAFTKPCYLKLFTCKKIISGCLLGYPL